ncbi:hypothetical protein ACHHYP_01811 [Achlya hypogyna]|uniref:Uncharacterized protein n=1 Tax=Achlya hypogyna TaxID=1202772 RepID=A0A1V9ZSU6_ACHHY|nr:hypothetical protein ACHHYP_01811 [Achlya hypogyna]
MQAHLKHTVDSAMPDDPGLFKGIYANKVDWSPSQVRELAQLQPPPLRPVDTSGKYHLRSIQHNYPIPGSQLLHEREREIAALAKKNMVFLKTSGPQDANARAKTTTTPKAAYEDCLHTLEQGKLHFLSTSLLDVLNKKEESLAKDLAARQHRLGGLQGDLATVESFWSLLLEGRTREATLLVTQHDFIDVNVAVNYDLHSKSISVEHGKSFELALTPLMVAARLHNVEIVTALLLNGADPQLSTANEDTALHYVWRDLPLADPSIRWVVRAKRASAVQQQLLAHGALANHQNSHGTTALHNVARLGLKEAAEQLLRHHGDPRLRDTNGRTPLDEAKAQGHDDVWSLLATFQTIDRVRSETDFRNAARSQFKTPGNLSLAWSPPPTQLLANIRLASHRATYLKGNFLTQSGALVLAADDEGTWAVT